MADFGNSWSYTGGREVRWYHHILDFANILKSFIGTNYLSLAYAFKMSGLGVGLGLMAVISSITLYCCHLLIACKNQLIEDLCYRELYRHHRRHENLPARRVDNLRSRLTHSMDYADVARLAMGAWGAGLVNAAVCVTQVCFCVQYAIFTGTMLNEMYLANGGGGAGGGEDVVGVLTTMIPGVSDFVIVNGTDVASTTFSSIADLVNKTSDEGITTSRISSLTELVPGNSTADVLEDGLVDGLVEELEESVVPFELLVFLPVVVFVPLTLFRNVRQMGWISVIANAAMFSGCFCVLIYIAVDFSVNPTFKWANVATIPVFIGSVTAAYEAIGVIIPVHASMENNHHNFGSCLNGAVVFFTAVLTTSGVLGYLQFGANIKQIIVENLPADHPVVIAIYVTLIIGVLLTYPLMIFPVIQLLESWIFGPGKLLGPAATQTEAEQKVDIMALTGDDKSSVSSEQEETRSLVGQSSGESSGSVTSYGLELNRSVSREVATWKRNVLRSAVAVAICLLAVALRQVFAYVGAFAGALGSCPLSFILPCLFHLRIQRHQLTRLDMFKNGAIMVLGVLFMLLGVGVTLKEMIIILSQGS